MEHSFTHFSSFSWNFDSKQRISADLHKTIFYSHFTAFHNRVSVATMTHNHNNPPHAIFNTTSGTCWKVNEVVHFDLKYRNSNLLAYFSALICDFSQFNKIPSSKPTKSRVLRIFANLLFMHSWRWGWAIYKFIWLEILFLLIHHTQLKTSQLKSGIRNYFQSSCL